MKSTPLPTIAALGALSGIRSSAAPAIVAEALAHRRGRREGIGARLLGAKAAIGATRAFAATELVLDQLPRAPERTAPSNLVPRIGAGALVGAALGSRKRGFLVPALVGGLAAFLAAHASLPLRRALVNRLPRVLAGFLEDVAVIGAGAALRPKLS